MYSKNIFLATLYREEYSRSVWINLYSMNFGIYGILKFVKNYQPKVFPRMDWFRIQFENLLKPLKFDDILVFVKLWKIIVTNLHEPSIEMFENFYFLKK